MSVLLAMKGKFRLMNTGLFDDLAAGPMRPAPELFGYARWGKRAMDIAIVLAMLPIALPIIALAWALTARQGGRGFFCQDRVGKKGRLFRCWKIRTMVPDADAALTRLVEGNAALGAEWHRAQKLDRDPRITRLGRILRKTSIDELPQLWNVMIGDMSLIGPRPFTPAQKALYDRLPNSEAYYALRPGISGLWQVTRRNSGDFSERARYDHIYASNLTPGQDLRILGRTFRAVVGATGK